jgi:hypothetical protein
VQPNDTDVHQELRTAFMKDEESAVAEQQAAQDSGDDTPEMEWQPQRNGVRFNEIASVHYTEERSTDAAEAVVAAGPPPPESLPYTGSDARRAVGNTDTIGADRAYRDKWEWGSKISWWQSSKKWSRE